MNHPEKALQKTSDSGSNVPVRGDAFDIGKSLEPTIEDKSSFKEINPNSFINSLDLNEEQADNVRSLIVGGGTGLVHKMLRKQLGDEVAGMLGGLLAGYAAKKIMDRNK